MKYSKQAMLNLLGAPVYGFGTNGREFLGAEQLVEMLRAYEATYKLVREQAFEGETRCMPKHAFMQYMHSIVRDAHYTAHNYNNRGLSLAMNASQLAGQSVAVASLYGRMAAARQILNDLGSQV